MGIVRKIDAMHRLYGCGVGKCRDCPHIIRKTWNRTYYKCLVYGDSNSEATDWRASYPACGLIDKPFPEDEIRVVKRLNYERDSEVLPGQISMDELMKGWSDGDGERHYNHENKWHEVE